METRGRPPSIERSRVVKSPWSIRKRVDVVPDSKAFSGKVHAGRELPIERWSEPGKARGEWLWPRGLHLESCAGLVRKGISAREASRYSGDECGVRRRSARAVGRSAMAAHFQFDA